MIDQPTAINGDMSVPVMVDSAALDWQPSPSGTVWRKRLHLVGQPESGQVTSVVRYDPGSSFPAHPHPDGEEIFVLDGVFSDEHGDWPAGTFLLNPEGFEHAPFSEQGCVLFVKLRQYAGTARHYVALDTNEKNWTRTDTQGVSIKPLYADRSFEDTMRLEQWAPGASRGMQSRAAGAEIFVLSGTLEDELGQHGEGTWLRLPEGAVHSPASPEGCTFYIKEGGLAALKSASSGI